MAGVEDRMARIKAIQEQAALKKKEAVEAAAKEKTEALESKTGERSQVEAELGNVGEELTKTESALAEVNAIDLGELDADSQAAVKAEVAGIQAEAEALKGKMAELADRKANLDAEIAALGGGEATPAEAPVEVTPEAPAEAAEAAPEIEGSTDEEKEGMQNDINIKREEEFRRLAEELTDKQTGRYNRDEVLSRLKEYGNKCLTEGKLLEAVIYLGGKDNTDNTVAHLEPKVFSDNVTELKRSVLTSEQQKNLDIKLVGYYAKSLRPREVFLTDRDKNVKENALSYVENNPEAINTYTDSLMEQTWTLEKIMAQPQFAEVKIDPKINEVYAIENWREKTRFMRGSEDYRNCRVLGEKGSTVIEKGADNELDLVIVSADKLPDSADFNRGIEGLISRIADVAEFIPAIVNEEAKQEIIRKMESAAAKLSERISKIQEIPKRDRDFLIGEINEKKRVIYG